MPHTPTALTAAALTALALAACGDAGAAGGGGGCRGAACEGLHPVTSGCDGSARRVATRDISRNTGDPETTGRVAVAELWRSRRCQSAWIRIVDRDPAADAEDVAAAAVLVVLRWHEVPLTKGQDPDGFTAGWQVRVRTHPGGRDNVKGARWSTMISTARGDRFQLCAHDLFHKDDGAVPEAGHWRCTPREQA